MKYIKQGLIINKLWRAEDESKNNVQVLMLAECTYYHQGTDILPYFRYSLIASKWQVQLQVKEKS